MLIIVSVLIKLDSSGPVFFIQKRMGFNGVLFPLIKFRTMVCDSQKEELLFEPGSISRVTRLGKILRATKLDELPQLINIILGTMSFVGPRPQVEKYTDMYQGREKIILDVKPGITDYASIKFINQEQILGEERVDEKYLREIEPEKNKLRIQYAMKHSFLIDLHILLVTFVRLLRIRSIWNIKN